MNSIVADTNILFSFFWEGSITKRIIISQYFKIYTPEFAITELLKYKSEIIKKTKKTDKEFANCLMELQSIISIVPKNKYSSTFRLIYDKINDKDDIDFIALALYLTLPLWSNDKELSNQSIVTILNTKEVIMMASDKFKIE